MVAFGATTLVAARSRSEGLPGVAEAQEPRSWASLCWNVLSRKEQLGRRLGRENPKLPTPDENPTKEPGLGNGCTART